MAEEKETVTLEDLVYSEMIYPETITRLLIKKGIITKEDLVEEVKAVNAKQQEKAGNVGIESNKRVNASDKASKLNPGKAAFLA